MSILEKILANNIGVQLTPLPSEKKVIISAKRINGYISRTIDQDELTDEKLLEALDTVTELLVAYSYKGSKGELK